jgi:hypothetical protein
LRRRDDREFESRNTELGQTLDAVDRSVRANRIEQPGHDVDLNVFPSQSADELQRLLVAHPRKRHDHAVDRLVADDLRDLSGVADELARNVDVTGDSARLLTTTAIPAASKTTAIPSAFKNHCYIPQTRAITRATADDPCADRRHLKLFRASAAAAVATLFPQIDPAEV